jgi:phage FluMu protein Com
MNEMGCITISCSHCGKMLSENDIYIYEGKHTCDDCAMKAGLFPLEHTGARRDKISERGRRLTMPKPYG